MTHITHRELIGSREGKDSTKRASVTELAYMLMGSDSLTDMSSYLGTNTLVPAMFDGLIYEDITREQLAPGVWRWAARYVEPRKSDESNDQIDVGEYNVSFDTTGGSLKVFWTPDHTNRVTAYPATPTSPPAGWLPPTDHKGGINMRKGTNGPEAQGVEIVIPVLKFTISYRRARDADEAAWFTYMKSIAALTGRVNDATFKTFAKGEVLFLGGGGKQGIQSDPVLDFQFAASPNITGLVFDSITGVDKNGHDYLWIESEPEVDGAAKRGRAKPVGVYVHELYEMQSFDPIGVGA
jgi:hypothetical protein